MSATGRKNPKGYSRPAKDFFTTPAWVTNSILEVYTSLGAAANILDPCAGDGSILKLLDTRRGPWIGRRHRLTARGFELDRMRVLICSARGLRIEHRDSLAEPRVSWGQPSAIIMNPPYSRAEEFVRRALEEVRPGGVVAALLRLGWLASKTRVPFHKEHGSDVNVLPKRPSFTSDGRTDASEYAWFVWPGDYRWTVLNPPTKKSSNE